MGIKALQQKIGYHGIFLGLIGLLASAALATANLVTHDEILAAEKHDLETSLKQVLPAGFADNDLLKDAVRLKRKDGKEVLVYRARLGNEPKGAVFQVSSRGYAGDVVALMGVDSEGKMLGVRVTKHMETPGLGDKIEVAKNSWILDFNGKSLGNPPLEKWGVKKDGGVFDQFAGATVTPRAVVKAVREGMEFYRDNRTEIYAKPAETSAKER
ncbi:electron transport complex subunit RsxG [Propionivibrio sp.]|uniref:electron transport complex subunit RsxG n=1 Tax=Propionivibrio sp. TaxID=2212460 RepID=UPI003BF15F85